MSWFEDLDYPTLGVFRADGETGWLGRSDPGANFYDLYVMRAENQDAPSPAALAKLEAAARDIDALKARSVAAICAARTARLNWRDGPSTDAWSITELRIDADGALWITLHEYETDEYSRWLMRTEAPHDIRRVPALALTGAPADAGALV